LPRHRVVSTLGLACAAALAVAAGGCSNKATVFDSNEGGMFSKPVDIFAKPDWARATGEGKTAELGPKGPVGPDDLVGPDGRCAPTVREPPPQGALPAKPEPPADRPVGSVAGDLAGPPMPVATAASANPADAIQVNPSAPQVAGGIALGMTECDAAQRAGLPTNVSIGNEKGERKVVLTYLTGTWPGIYTFNSGRLKIIDRAPTPPVPPKEPPKKKANTAAKPKTTVQ
jgi:hypothetical protein